MHWFVLLALFTTPENMTPHPEDAFSTRTYDTLAECEENRKRMAKFIADRIKNPRVKSAVFCVRVGVYGYLEGLENLRRSTGDPT